jgi:hypothetical protein
MLLLIAIRCYAMLFKQIRYSQAEGRGFEPRLPLADFIELTNFSYKKHRPFFMILGVLVEQTAPPIAPPLFNQNSNLRKHSVLKHRPSVKLTDGRFIPDGEFCAMVLSIAGYI